MFFLCWQQKKLGPEGSLMTQFPKFRFIKRDVGSIEFHSDAGCKSFTSTFVSFFSFFFVLPAFVPNVSFACSCFPFCVRTTVRNNDGWYNPSPLDSFTWWIAIVLRNECYRAFAALSPFWLPLLMAPDDKNKEKRRTPVRMMIPFVWRCLFLFLVIHPTVKHPQSIGEPY